MGIKNRDEWLNEGHSYDQELENARNFKSSASELQQWAERKIAESRPENFKEGVINPIQEGDMTNKYGGFLITHGPSGTRFKPRYKKGVDSKKREEAAFAKILKDNPKVKPSDLKITGYYEKGGYNDLVQDVPVRLDEAKDSYAIMRLVNGRTKELIEGTIEEIMSQFSKAIDDLRNSGSGKQFKEDPKTIEELVHYLNAAQQYSEKKDKPKNTYAIQESINEASRWKGKEIYPNWVKPSDIKGFVKKEDDLEVGKDYVFFEPGMNSWQAEYTYKGTVGSGAGFGYKFTTSAQFSTAPEEFFSKADMADMIKSKELAVMESELVAEGTAVKKGDYVLYKGNGTKWVKSKIMQIIPSKRKLHIDWNDEYIEVDAKDVKPVKESVNEADKEWSDDVKTDWSPPKGLFTEPAPKIADVLHKESDDLDQAMSRLMFYINRAGKLLSPKVKAELETAKKLLQQKYA